MASSFGAKMVVGKGDAIMTMAGRLVVLLPSALSPPSGHCAFMSSCEDVTCTDTLRPDQDMAEVFSLPLRLYSVPGKFLCFLISLESLWDSDGRSSKSLVQRGRQEF